MSITIEELLKVVGSYNSEEVDVVRKAYDYANRLHEGQFRQSGEPYIVHPLNVAYILAEMHADKDTLCAGLLHDTLEDTNVTKEDLIIDFGVDVANLVDGVTKISKLNFSSKKEEIAANTRKIITGLTEDVRIIIIKLADRLHNMRTLEFKSEFKQKENSLETMEIFVPLAYYIGAYRIKSELEDIAFRYLYPETYKRLMFQRDMVEKDSNECLEEMLYKINSVLDKEGINHEIKVRMKNIYGISKRLKEVSTLGDIHDLLSLKIMVNEEAECYRTLGLVHKEYHPMPKRIKDYICNPKTNMYQSLHTTVFGPNDRLVQTQIRTFDMDKVASFGISTYWDIEKGNARITMQEDLKKKYQFFKSLLEINKVFGDNQEFVRQVKEELFSDQVYVYTPKGDRIALPKGATPVDFAYKIHTQIGNTMRWAIVNNEQVEDDYLLKNDDIVTIITDPLAYGLKPEREQIVVTAKAKRKIKEFNKG